MIRFTLPRTFQEGKLIRMPRGVTAVDVQDLERVSSGSPGQAYPVGDEGTLVQNRALVTSSVTYLRVSYSSTTTEGNTFMKMEQGYRTL